MTATPPSGQISYLELRANPGHNAFVRKKATFTQQKVKRVDREEPPNVGENKTQTVQSVGIPPLID